MKQTLLFALFFASIVCFGQVNPNNAYTNSRGCIVCDLYAAGDTFSLDAGATWYTVVDRPLLDTMRVNGVDMSKVCVSLVTDMSALFQNKNSFNADISSWDVSNVTDMSGMFSFAQAFNQDLSSWCVTNIPTQPSNFSSYSSLTAANHPVWGTCPPAGQNKSVASGANGSSDQPTAAAKGEEDVRVLIYPNPTQGVFYVQSDKEASFILVKNLSGKTIAQQPVNGVETRLDLSLYASGIYLVEVHGATFVSTHRIIRN
ncbi:MAG: BspA family leucine-rich repeat surface protein [Flavobacteriia bacterium]|nr:BspA family leucine-rich repeat surface protein [Flavobacteriia bacterium]